MCEKMVGRLKEEWSRYKETVLEVTEMCGSRRIRKGKRRKGSEWWNE